jgi:hypothetical protein
VNVDEILRTVRDEYDADVIVFTGPISRPYDDRLIDDVKINKCRTNALLILATFGGDPTAAYRMARCLKRSYDEVIVYLNSSCYSAGTMLSLCADRIIIDDHAEFGPIDVQIRHKDEIGERVSGLTSRSALSLATDETPQTFGRIFLRLRKEIGLSTKLAADVAATLTDSTIGKLFQQLDPMKLAEDSRSVKIIEQYAERIASRNVRDGAIDALVNNYPDHSFVIDPKEASEKIFHKTETPTESLEKTGERIKLVFGDRLYANDPLLIFLVPEPVDDQQPKETENDESKPATDSVSDGVDQDEKRKVEIPEADNTSRTAGKKNPKHPEGAAL